MFIFFYSFFTDQILSVVVLTGCVELIGEICIIVGVLKTRAHGR